MLFLFLFVSYLSSLEFDRKVLFEKHLSLAWVCVPLANQLFSINDFYRIKVMFQRFASVQILIISTFAHICIEP